MTLIKFDQSCNPAGNRTQMVHFDGVSTETISYDYNDFNQITNHTGVYGIIHDDNGNMDHIDLGADLQYYHHNRENRLVSSEGPGGTVDYDYDASGRLLTRTDNSGNKEKYYYDGINTLLVKEKLSGGSWRTKRIYILKQAPIGQILAERENTAWSGSTPTAHTDNWYHYDLLGNVTARTDAAGQVTDLYDMEAFGDVLIGSQDGAHLTTKRNEVNPFQTFFFKRWYAPRLGRWLESEREKQDGLNGYLFVRNQPTALIDTNGQQSHRPPPGEDEQTQDLACHQMCNELFHTLAEQEWCYEMCTGNDPGPAPEPVPVPPPQPTPRPHYYMKAAKAGAAVGAGYCVYRIIRFLPSLYPPLWWSLPENFLAL